MNEREVRQLIMAISGTVLIGLIIVYRRSLLLRALPEIVEERIVLPAGNYLRENLGTTQPDAPKETPERMTRKVGRNRKISVGGKLYGPLDAALVGQQVEVEEREDQIVVWSDSTEVGTFEQQ